MPWRTWTLISSAVLALAYVGCSKPDAGAGGDSAAPSSAASAIAPPPFTAAQIRDATAPGRTYVFEIAAGGGPAGRQRIRFLSADADGTTMSSVHLDAEGRPAGEPTKTDVTWADLVGHASYDKDATTIADDSVTVPAGSFETRRYTVDNGDGTRTTAHFAKALPGAPVSHIVTREGVVVSRMVLVEHRAGRRAPK